MPSRIPARRLVAMAFGHAGVVAGVVFLTLWTDSRNVIWLLVTGVAVLVGGLAVIAFMLRTHSRPNAR